MPTYEYICGACEHEFELFQQMSDGVKRKCPKCEKLALKRKIGTGGAIILKGSGFHETDYARPAREQEKLRRIPATEDNIKRGEQGEL